MTNQRSLVGGGGRGRRGYRTLGLLPAPLAVAYLSLAPFLVITPVATAQLTGSVYVDDSPAAQDGIARAVELAGVGNTDEANRVLQRLLDDCPDQLVVTPTDPDLYISVRARVNAVLMSSERLLARYRESESAAARALLDTGQPEVCERTRLLTDAGFDAALVLAQRHVDAARFFAAWRTLRQLDAHPDFSDHRADRATALLELAAGYIGQMPDAPDDESADVARVLASWRERTGRQPATARPSLPRIERGRGPLDLGAHAELSGMLQRPLASEFMGLTLNEVQTLATRGGGQRGVPTTASVLQAIPTVAGDTLYINDSETISAWDRFTLSKRWRVRVEPPPGPFMSSPAGGPGLEDCNWVQAEGRRLLTVGGLAASMRAVSERTISVLDTRDGRVLWSTTLSRAATTSAPVLAECFPRGPAIIHEGVAVVSASRSSVEKRLQGAYMLAFDLESGRVLWARNLGSQGVVPWGSSGFPADISTARAGVVYRADRIGVICALEALTGRPVWVRRVAPDQYNTAPVRPGRAQPWEGASPVFDRGRIIALGPDKQRVVSLEASSGRILERLPASILGNPDYLLAVPAPGSAPGSAPTIVAVGAMGIGAIEPEGLIADAPLRVLAKVPAPGVRGRVSVAADTLVVPVIEGAMLVPLAAQPRPADAPDADRVIRLEHPGHVLALDSQLIVADDQQVHSYLLWETANTLLQKRMTADPGNPAPAVTFAELSYRAGRHENLLSAVDRAVKAIEADPVSVVAAVVRPRLFESMLEMVEPSPENSTLARLSNDLRRRLIDRLLQLAATPAEQVQALMSAASFAQGAGKPAEAVEHYQAILLAPALAAENYSRFGTTVPAEAEAVRRLRRLVRESGRAVYQAYDAEAQDKLDAASRSTDDAAIERLARSYPVSRAAPRAWLELARRHRAAARELPALTALEEALASTENALEPGDPVLSEIGGQLVTQIAASDRARAALRMLDQVERRLGSGSMTVGGTPINVAALRAGLSLKLAAAERRPRFGAPSGSAAVLTGWGILEPICADAPGAPTDRVVLGATNGEIALWKLGASRDGSPTLDKVWGDPAAEAFLRLDARSVLLARRAGTGSRFDQGVTRRDLETGKPLWEITGFRALFSDRSRRPFPTPEERVDTPLRGAVPASEVLVLVDDRTLAMVDRVGRAAAFDYESGKLLWAAELDIERVFDAGMSDGTLAVAGLPAPGFTTGTGAPDQTVQCAVHVLSARTGQTLLRQGERTQINWVRITPEGGVAVGTGAGVAMFDPFRAEMTWRNESPLVHDCPMAWPLSGRLVVRNSESRLLLLDASTGQLNEQALNTREKADQASVELNVREAGELALMLSIRGFTGHDRDGRLLFADSLPHDAIVSLPLLGHDTALLVERGARESGIGDGGLALYAVHVASITSGKMLGSASIELPASPNAAAVMDGAVVVSSGSATVLLSAPWTDAPR